ncbi:hypothetical protein JCM10207_006398 [Rhodosporidiobolus poonsookiae]
MASSVYSSTPAPPARIRVVSHSPLPPFRAWLPLPSADGRGQPPVVADLLRVVAGMMQGEYEVEAELQGFALLPNSPLSMLDPVNDVLEIKAASSAHTGAPVPATLAARVPIPPSPTTRSRRSSSTSSASSSSSSSSSCDSDSPPETASTKRPLTNGHAAASAVERPAKRARTASTSSASSSSSSSVSTSSSSSSDSSDSSSDSESNSDSSTSPSSTSQSAAKAAARADVPPGSGMRRTQKRNERKRKLRAAKAAERRASGGMVQARVTGTKAQPASAEDKEQAIEFDPVPQPSVPPPAAEAASLAASTPSLPLAAALSAVAAPPVLIESPSTLVSPSRPSLHHTPSVALSTGGEPGISLVGAGYANTPPSRSESATPQRQKKGKQSKKPRQHQHQKQAHGFFDAPQPSLAGLANGSASSSAGTTRRVSPEYRPQSPDLSAASYALPPAPAVPPSPQPQTPAKEAPNPRASGGKTRPPPFVPPSKRDDLPPWMVVTSVDVEAKGWEVGVGRRVRGTSRNWVAEQREEKEAEVVVQNGLREVEEIDATEVEKRWDGLRTVGRGEAKEGMQIAVKVLELDPTTFAPSLSLKFGPLVSSSSPASFSIQLHPSCLPAVAEPDEYDEEYVEEEEEEGFYGAQLKKKLRFGQDLLGRDEADGQDGVWEGEWEGADVRLVV